VPIATILRNLSAIPKVVAAEPIGERLGAAVRG
jgi:hypothetical protein